ncbi:DNA-3-methyladenine glycosylase family protein [Comamonas endophytica]|uniref:DNA-3-methyladenine glycosylase II n=1 Tax=Comamonas endophytica TaxID=2949090 RepID=A0ABY6G7C8_9BURK|nr:MULTISPECIES: AlkA N-terminal domain-containing protein [unclassified Acidovorax]MCD2511550.1 3-methyladenine DNA glycosylase 2 [Acidovorax sp. D4N7]UYG50934.1 3-methyladenine DNA glycosylase 2 [Acidovorax sp. 5MLIR]
MPPACATPTGWHLPLPTDFRSQDFLAFHARDREALAERVGPASLCKGLLWRGQPACLQMDFTPGAAQVQWQVAPGQRTPAAQEVLPLVQRMLGLAQDVAAFEARWAAHPQLGPLIARQPGLRVPVTATPFEALAWAIMGQQISVAAALSLRRRVILAAGLRHESGLYCHPQAAQLLALGSERLRAAGLSQSKAQSLLAVSEAVQSGALPLDAWALLPQPPAAEIHAALLAIKGIGPWTVSYALLRGFGWLDGSLHGDVAVRRGIAQLLQADVDQRRAQAWLAPFAPWRALVAAHLWAMLAMNA